MSQLDAGMSRLDAGMSQLDAGMSPLDAGMSPLDAGIKPVCRHWTPVLGNQFGRRWTPNKYLKNFFENPKKYMKKKKIEILKKY